MGTFFENVHFWGCNIFSSLVVIQSIQFSSGSTYLSDSCFWWSIFPLDYQNAYGHQTFQGASMEGCCEITWQIKHMSLPAEKYGQQSRQAADLVKETPKHNPLITWPKRGHVTIWKIYISTFVTFIANKLGKLLTLGRIFSMQMLKSSPTSC